MKKVLLVIVILVSMGVAVQDSYSGDCPVCPPGRRGPPGRCPNECGKYYFSDNINGICGTIQLSATGPTVANFCSPGPEYGGEWPPWPGCPFAGIAVRGAVYAVGDATPPPPSYLECEHVVPTLPSEGSTFECTIRLFSKCFPSSALP